MNKIKQMTQDIIKQILKQNKISAVSNPQKQKAISDIMQNNKALQFKIYDIKNIVQLTKINIKRLKLTDFSTEKQYDVAINKLVSQQKRILSKLYKKIVQMNNISVTIQEAINSLAVNNKSENNQ